MHAYWNTIAGICRGESADTVYVFTIVNNNGQGAGYRYNPSEGNRTFGNGWVAEDTARSLYLSAVAAGQAGNSGAVWGSTVAWFCYSSRTQWAITAQSFIKSGSPTSPRLQGNSGITVRPGDALYWDHELRNAGPQATDRALNVTINRSAGAAYALSPPLLSIANTSGPNSAIATGRPAGTVFYSVSNLTLDGSPSHTPLGSGNTTVQQSDVGRNLCQSVTASPGGTSVGSVTSVAACATVPYNYVVNPSVDIGVTTITGPGAVPNTGTISNPSESVTKSKPLEWRKSLIIVMPGAGSDTRYPTGGQVDGAGDAPCIGTTGGFYGGPGVATCSTIAQGSGTEVLPGNSFDDSTATTLAVDYELGTKICIAMSVRPRSSTADDWAHAIRCVKAGKKPKVEVWGGSIMVGRSVNGASIRCGEVSVGCSQISTSLTIKSPTSSFGSWGEYGLFAPSTVSLTASASGLDGGSTFLDQKSWSAMTFNNADVVTSPAFGGYIATSAQLPDITTLFPAGDAVQYGTTEKEQTWNPGILSGNVRPQNGVTTINLTSAAIQSGRWIVINAPESTVMITGDITYAGGLLTEVSQIPQLIIHAREINIAGSVTRVDAWLLTPSGGISTCSDGNATASGLGVNYAAYPLSIVDCARQLRINGPVIASKLYLRRTYGSQDTQGGNAASGEIIVIRPDSYMWTYNQARTATVLRTTSLTELPPRY